MGLPSPSCACLLVASTTTPSLLRMIATGGGLLCPRIKHYNIILEPSHTNT